MKPEVGMSAEREGVGGDQGSRRVRVVGTAIEEKELPEGGRRMQMVEVFSGQILHRCPGPRLQGRVVMLD